MLHLHLPSLTTESVDSLSGDGTPTREWVLGGMADSNQVGSPERLAELERNKRKAEGMTMTIV